MSEETKVRKHKIENVIFFWCQQFITQSSLGTASKRTTQNPGQAKTHLVPRVSHLLKMRNPGIEVDESIRAAYSYLNKIYSPATD